MKSPEALAISIVIPVFNGEETVEPLVEEINRSVGREREIEIIFVHDCGPDKSLGALHRLKQEYPTQIKVVELTRNFGQHNATICGFEHANHDWIVTMDEDLQHDPAEVSLLISHQATGNFDVVYGQDQHKRKHSKFRNITSQILHRMLSIAIPDLHPHYSAFRLIRASVAKQTISMRNSYTFLDGYISWITTRTSSCPVIHRQRHGGKSGYDLKRLVEHAINVFITFSNLPLRLLLAISVVIFSLTIIYSSYIIAMKTLYPETFLAGFPTLIVAIGLGTAANLLGLGVVGEYIYRINLKTTKRPTYIKRSRQ